MAELRGQPVPPSPLVTALAALLRRAAERAAAETRERRVLVRRTDLDALITSTVTE